MTGVPDNWDDWERPSSSSKEAGPWPHSHRIAKVDAEHPGTVQAGRLGPAESAERDTGKVEGAPGESCQERTEVSEAEGLRARWT